MKWIDTLKQMDGKEMAGFLNTFATCHYCVFGENGDKSCLQASRLEDIPDCEEGIRQFLEKEREGEEA